MITTYRFNEQGFYTSMTLHILTLRYDYTYNAQDNYTQRTTYAYCVKTNKELIYLVENREIEYY